MHSSEKGDRILCETCENDSLKFNAVVYSISDKGPKELLTVYDACHTAISSDGKRLLSANILGRCQLIEVETDKELKVFKSELPVIQVSFHENGLQYATRKRIYFESRKKDSDEYESQSLDYDGKIEVISRHYIILTGENATHQRTIMHIDGGKYAELKKVEDKKQQPRFAFCQGGVFVFVNGVVSVYQSADKKK